MTRKVLCQVRDNRRPEFNPEGLPPMAAKLAIAQAARSWAVRTPEGWTGFFRDEDRARRFAAQRPGTEIFAPETK